MAIISNAVTIADAGAFSASLGAMTHIKTLTASNSANLTFHHGTSSVVLNNTYPIYKFEFINMHPITDGVNLLFQGNAVDASGFNETITSTTFRAIHDEDDSPANLSYEAGNDQAQGTAFQILGNDIGNDNDQSCSGYLHLFNPSSTTFVKHFLAEANYAQGANIFFNQHIAGYFNLTAAIDEIQFKMSSGNIDSGTIKLYGIKDS